LWLGAPKWGKVNGVDWMGEVQLAMLLRDGDAYEALTVERVTKRRKHNALSLGRAPFHLFIALNYIVLGDFWKNRAN
jgi:hypothetical protein